MSPADRHLEFIGPSKDDLSSLPPAVKRHIGFALRMAQKGLKHADAKPLKGFGNAAVLETVSDFDRNTFRAIHTVRLKDTTYVLHVFQKKSENWHQDRYSRYRTDQVATKIAEALHKQATESRE